MSVTSKDSVATILLTQEPAKTESKASAAVEAVALSGFQFQDEDSQGRGLKRKGSSKSLTGSDLSGGAGGDSGMCKACDDKKAPGAKYCIRHKQAAQSIRHRLRTAQKKNPDGEELAGNSGKRQSRAQTREEK